MNRSHYVAEKGVDYDGDDACYSDTESSSQSEHYVKQPPIKNTSSNPIKEKEKHLENGDVGEENHDTMIFMLFKDARNKLEKIDSDVKQQKKQIVVELAKNLEGKISTATICMEIVNQLRGHVSEGFVRECLDEKYKQKHRVENARKQKKKQGYLEDKDAIDKLAAVTPLNPESANHKVIMVGADGHTVVQRVGENDDKQFPNGDDDCAEGNSEPTSPTLSNKNEQKQQGDKKKDHLGSSECPGCIDLYSRILDLEWALKQNQFISADKMILDFEFCIPYKDINRYIESLQQYGDSADVWFSGKIDTSTGKVVSSGYGRIRQHKEQEPLSRDSIDDDDDDWEDVE